jgi:hypothetical protein
MKKHHQYHWCGWLALVSLFLLLACQKEPQPLQTRLDILVVDAQQKPIAGAEALIKASTGSYVAGTQKIEYYGSFVADKAGRILFDKITPAKGIVSVSPVSPRYVEKICPDDCYFLSGTNRAITITLLK